MEKLPLLKECKRCNFTYQAQELDKEGLCKDCKKLKKLKLKENENNEK